MKVMCILESKHSVGIGKKSIIKVGEVYTVIDSKKTYFLPGLFYKLEEDPYPNAWYAEELFAPLSDIDEQELFNNSRLKELQEEAQAASLAASV